MGVSRVLVPATGYTVLWDGTDRSDPYLGCRRDPVQVTVAPRVFLAGPTVDLQARVLRAVQESPRAMTVRTVSEQTGVARETCRVIVARAVKRQVLVKVERRQESKRHYAWTYRWA